MFCSGRTRPANARSSGSETLLRIRFLAGCISGTLESQYSEATGYALAWFLVNDRVKLLAYRIFDSAKVRTSSDLSRRSPNGPLNYTSSKVAVKVTLLRLGSMHRVKSEKGDPKMDRCDPGGWRR